MRFFATLLKTLLRISIVAAGAALIAKFVVKSEGEPDSDEFRRVAIFGGDQFRSTAQAAKRGNVIAGFGGVQLDLRRAKASPSGMHLDVLSIFGGVQLVVPDDWVVDHEQAAIAGGIDVRVADPATLPEDSSHLRINAKAIFGGISVVARPVIQAAAD
jgi:predicted membrane protein